MRRALCSFQHIARLTTAPATRAFSTARMPPPGHIPRPSPAAAAAPAQKHCRTCGRLISPTHRHFAQRKTCSKACAGTKLGALDRELEAAIAALARERGSVEVGVVEGLFSARGLGLEGPAGGEEGQRRAKWRERVRRAARRVVVGLAQEAGGSEDADGGGEGGGREFTCVQEGRAVEPSFAKGEWAVRWVGS